MDHKALKRLVERRHPEYGAQLAHWEFMEATYRGGREWFASNIFPYFKEGPKEYQDRVARAYRFNHTREVVDLVNKHLFRGEIARSDDAPEAVKTFWKRATRTGDDIGELMRRVSNRGSVLGRPWVVVDNANRSTEEQTTKAEEQPYSIYAYVVPPQDVLDWSWGNDGELNWILIREYTRDDKDPLDDNCDVKEKFRLWDRERWLLVGKSSNGRTLEVEDQGEHGLGLVPAIPADNVSCSDPWTSPALIADIAYLDRAVANYLSNLDAIIQDQTFSQLTMPAQNVLPGEDVYNKLIEMGTKRVFLYDGESGVSPAYISPDPKQAELILSTIQTIINEIYHSVGLAGERTKQDNAKGIDNSSGVAKQKDFERVLALLSAKADALEGVENKIVRIVCKWAGEEPPVNDLVTYSEDFDVHGLWDEFDVAVRLAAIDAPASVRSIQMEALVEKLFPTMKRELLERLKADIKQWGKDLQANADLAASMQAEKANLLGEAKRNRAASGKTQSDTKSRVTGTTQDRETGQEIN